MIRWPAGLLYAPEVMRRLAGNRARDTLRRRILHGGIGRFLDDTSACMTTRMVHATRLEVPLHESVRVCLPMYVLVLRRQILSHCEQWTDILYLLSGR